MSKAFKTYEKYFGQWKPEYGKKPTIKEINDAEVVARSGSKTAFAVAMGLREQGVTQSTIVKVLGLPHRNKIKQLEATKKVRVKKTGARPAVLH